MPGHAKHGRGAAIDPPNRFEGVEIVPEDIEDDRPCTVVVADHARSVLTSNASPDVPFELSVNPYRGCEHGCAYCYARTFHEYLGWSAGLEFETRIAVKFDAARLLQDELARPGYRPRPISLSGATDPYQPLERQLEITRSVLEVLAETRHPVGVVTKNRLVVRDTDLLARLAAIGAARVWVSITSLDGDLVRRLEPRTSQPSARLDAIRRLTDAGIGCGVLAAPMIPGLTDHELPAILEAAAAAGARWARSMPVRLPGAVARVFRDWLEREEPSRVTRILGRIRSMRGGGLDDAVFGRRMRGEGPHAENLHQLLRVAARRHGLQTEPPELASDVFVPPGGLQLGLFGTGVSGSVSGTISTPTDGSAIGKQ